MVCMHCKVLLPVQKVVPSIIIIIIIIILIIIILTIY